MILKTLFRGIENPATTLSDPDNWLVDAFGGGTGSSGEVINAETALEYPAVYRGVALLSGDVAKIPLIIYRRGPDGVGKERATSHPAYRLLRYKPNEFQTANTFREMMQAQVLLWGNAYAFIERHHSGAPSALLPLDPAMTQPVRIDGRVWYEHVTDAGRTLIPWTNVFHLRGLPSRSTGGLAGVSVIQKAKEALGLGLAALKFGARFFANDASPRTVLETPGKLKPEARQNLRESWERMHRGVGNAHRTAILEQGLKLNAFSVHPEDAQLLQTREHEIRATVANFLGLPPHMLGDNSRTSFSSLESENQSYLDRSLDPWLLKWEFEAWDKLLTDRQQRADTHIVEFLRAALVRADLKGRFGAYRIALENGILNLDEVRDRENLNPLPDGLGQDFVRPMNLGVIGAAPPPPPPALPPPEPDPDEAGDGDQADGDVEGERDARRELVVDAVRRVVKRLRFAAGKADKRGDLTAWLGAGLTSGHREAAQAIMGPVLRVCREITLSPDVAVTEIWTALDGSPDAWVDSIPDAVVGRWSA